MKQFYFLSLLISIVFIQETNAQEFICGQNGIFCQNSELTGFSYGYCSNCIIDERTLPPFRDSNNKPLNGKVVQYADTPMFEAEVKDGKLNGVIKQYIVPSIRDVKVESHYKEGKLEGIKKYYDKDGKVFMEEEFQSGILTTKRNFIKTTFNDKVLISEIKFDIDGTELTRVEYYNNEKMKLNITKERVNPCPLVGSLQSTCKVYQTFFDDGQIHEEQNGDGSYKEYYENGQLKLNCAAPENSSHSGHQNCKTYNIDGTESKIGLGSIIWID